MVVSWLQGRSGQDGLPLGNKPQSASTLVAIRNFAIELHVGEALISTCVGNHLQDGPRLFHQN